MRAPLKKFVEFTNTLLPNETTYLLSIQQFEEANRLKILKLADYNARNIGQFTPYDTTIDKRKYNYLQNWVAARLKAIDVDEQLSQMLDWERKIATDSIEAAEEKALLKAIRRYEHTAFFFSRFFELAENYRHFLLIRLRYADHRMVDSFVNQHRASYLQAKQIKEKLHDASQAIVGQYAGKGDESSQWEGWLSEIFYNEKLEGHIRYLALVRLVFICHNYRKYNLLRDKFEYLEKKFDQGFYYSKRLLVNYYHNRLMMHAHFREYDKAVHYGYLSVRAKTHDYLLYVNNLSAVLLRLNRNQEALELLKKALPEAKKTVNFHNRIGFVAFYMEALNKNGLSKNAEQYGDLILNAYPKEVMQYRWHLFFSVYFQALFMQNRCEKLLKIAKKHSLRHRDKAYRPNANYLPVIPMYIEAAQYKEGNISQTQFFDMLKECLDTHQYDQGTPFRDFLTGLQKGIPEIGSKLG